MQHVHPVQREKIDLPLHEFHILKMPASIEQQPPMLQHGLIADDTTGQGHSFPTSARFTRHRHQLPQRRPAPEQAGRRSGLDFRALPVDLQHIGFIAFHFRIQDEGQPHRRFHRLGRIHHVHSGLPQPSLHNVPFRIPRFRPGRGKPSLEKMGFPGQFNGCGMRDQPPDASFRHMRHTARYHAEKTIQQNEGYKGCRLHALKVVHASRTASTSARTLTGSTF